MRYRIFVKELIEDNSDFRSCTPFLGKEFSNRSELVEIVNLYRKENTEIMDLTKLLADIISLTALAVSEDSNPSEYLEELLKRFIHENPSMLEKDSIKALREHFQVILISSKWTEI